MATVRIVAERLDENDVWHETEVGEFEYVDPEYMYVVVDGEPLFKFANDVNVELRDGIELLDE